MNRKGEREVYGSLNVLSDKGHELQLTQRHKKEKEKYMNRKRNAGKWTNRLFILLR